MFDNTRITIENILKDSKMDLICNKCKNLISSKVQFSSCPKILIIIFKKKINNINFYYSNKMNIVDNKGRNNKYELISIIKNIENNENEFETFCNTSVNKGIWYKYYGENKTQKFERNELFNFLNKEKSNVPYLLIYQNNNLHNQINDITIKDNEIKELKSKLSRYPFELSEKEKIICVIFMSIDETIIYSIICKNTDIFSDLEKKFYKIYPEYIGESAFTINGRTINKEISLEENNIHNNSLIIIKNN